MPDLQDDGEGETMKTISESGVPTQEMQRVSCKEVARLKAEIAQDKKEIVKFMEKAYPSVLKAIQEETRQSISQKIAEDVGKCEIEMEVVIDHAYQFKKCKSVPEAQKCEKCQGKLEIKRWLE